MDTLSVFFLAQGEQSADAVMARLSTFIRDTKWCFPAIELVHLFGIVTLLGTMLAFDLRLMDIWLRRWPVSVLMKRLLPWTWRAFAVMVCTGAGLFISDPVRFFENTSFRIKLVLIGLAGLRHAFGRRNPDEDHCHPCPEDELMEA